MSGQHMHARHCHLPACNYHHLPAVLFEVGTLFVGRIRDPAVETWQRCTRPRVQPQTLASIPMPAFQRRRPLNHYHQGCAARPQEGLRLLLAHPARAARRLGHGAGAADMLASVA